MEKAQTIKRTGPKRLMKSVENVMLHLIAYNSKRLDLAVAEQMMPLLGQLDEFARRMGKIERRISWATRPGRHGPGRLPKRPLGRPPKKRGPGRPPKRRGPGRPRLR